MLDGTLDEIFAARTLGHCYGFAQKKKAPGAALVVHAAADDYKTDPAGNAGDRIACGVVTP
jgi:Cu/Zn superoxide dismutase